MIKLAFYLDNQCIASRGGLPDPMDGNPGIGGAEYATLAAVRVLSQESKIVEPLLFLTAEQQVDGIQDKTFLVNDFKEALSLAATHDVASLVFRPGFLKTDEWELAEQSSTPLIAWCHNLGCKEQYLYEKLPSIKRWIFLSGAQQDYFRHSRLFGMSEVVPYYVGVPKKASLTKPDQFYAKASDIVYIGAITPFKSFDRLATAWPKIAEKNPNCRLRVFGGSDLYQGGGSATLTPYEKHCRHILAEGGFSERVSFEGSKGLERYEQIDSIAVGVVNPSGNDETFCLSAAELSACGIPVVAPRRHVFIQTVQDRKTGLLCDRSYDLASACNDLLNDFELRRQLGRNGQEHIQKSYSSVIVASRWEGIASDVSLGIAPKKQQPSTPLWHELRIVRQIWSLMFWIPRWPSWPVLKQSVKSLIDQDSTAITPRGVSIVSLVLATTVSLLILFAKYDGNPTGFARVGDQIPVSTFYSQQKIVILKGKRGNDGQQYLSIAADPLQLNHQTKESLDNPIYRGKRILYPLIAHIIGFASPVLIPWSLVAVNILALSLSCWLVSSWASHYQYSPIWGFAPLALPAYWITLTLDTADLVATTLLLSTAYAWLLKKRYFGSASISLSLLTRETSLLIWFSTITSIFKRRRYRWLIPVGLAAVPWILWTSYLNDRFKSTADGFLATLHFGAPLSGVIHKALLLLSSLTSLHSFDLAVESLFDASAFCLWLFTIACLIVISLNSAASFWVRCSSALYLLPAICSSLQILNRFPDYTRVWIDLSSLALIGLIQTRHKYLVPFMLGSGVISIGYMFGYVVLAP